MSLSQEDIDRVVKAVHAHYEASTPFHINPETHYNQHQRLDRMLDAYEGAQSIFWKWILGTVLSIFLLLSYLGSKTKGLLP